MPGSYFSPLPIIIIGLAHLHRGISTTGHLIMIFSPQRLPLPLHSFPQLPPSQVPLPLKASFREKLLSSDTMCISFLSPSLVLGCYFDNTRACCINTAVII